ELLEVGPPTLAAAVTTSSGRTSRVLLPPPDGPSRVRLLRDPLPDRAAPHVLGERKSPHVPDSNLVITSCGERVFARARGGGIIAYPVPHSAKGGVGRPKLHFADTRHTPSAVGWQHRGVAALFVE